ncbi:hypothetical protein [Robertmurraya sp. Marseille-Q9965]
MDFLLVGIALWGLLIFGGLLFLYGLWKKSWLAYFLCGLTLLIPSIILATQKGIFILFILLPLVAFGFAVSEKR